VADTLLFTFILI